MIYPSAVALLTLRKQRLPCENKVDLKKSKSEADLEILAKINLFLEQNIRNPDLKNNFMTSESLSDLKISSQVS